MPFNSTEYNKKYYHEHKQQIIAHLGERKLCEVCKREYPLYHLYRHFKSLKHIRNLKNKNGLNT